MLEFRLLDERDVMGWQNTPPSPAARKATRTFAEPARVAFMQSAKCTVCSKSPVRMNVTV